MNRIKLKFETLKSAGKKALIPYITPEFPFKGITVPLLHELEKGGADLIEVGIPFSDPLADGETIQHSSDVTIKNGISIPQILDSVKEFRTTSELPVLLMGYMNPILHFGMENFLKASRDAGVDGIIVPDLPPEEASEFKKISNSYGISNVFLIAPTTADERMRKIDELSTDFSYCVSVTGVTGARTQLGSNGSFDAFLQRVGKNVKKPFVVGFGISRAEHVSHVWQFADGAVVGSALINVLGNAHSQQEALDSAKHFLISLRPS
ncbi:MAG: tryptophan synthase subunit alpha [Ignavibacteriales bacterium]|nr:tryptophan synthase subunit alpha [Ignavibacteriales bacterium]